MKDDLIDIFIKENSTWIFILLKKCIIIKNSRYNSPDRGLQSY